MKTIQFFLDSWVRLNKLVFSMYLACLHLQLCSKFGDYPWLHFKKKVETNFAFGAPSILFYIIYK